ncbi:MAG: BTAD domain-containing putative transcriptional regulator [Eubacteriales bacterium]|nr:BTAD domain-containing putative transcriptional regulator [Eubacteriales bacterium]
MEGIQHEISACLLGEFSIAVDGSTVSGPLTHSKKLRGVAQYLLLHADRPVSHTELYEAFWPGEKSANPRAALKTLMHRLRGALVEGGAPETVQFFVVQQGTYQWNPALRADIDVNEFERLWQELQSGGLRQAQRIARLQRMTALYRGRLLNDTELWMIAPAAYLHGCYLKAVNELCELLFETDRQDEIVTVCRAALRFDELDESLNIRLIHALVATGRTQEAMAQYQHVTELCYDEFGVQVSDELRALYRKIARAEQATELDVDNVRDSLEEKTGPSGAYVCEYGIFQDIYRIEERCLSRYGGRIFLGLLTVTDAYCDQPEQPVLAKAMDQLLTAARTSLRNCDVVARFSPAQYVLLLPTVTYETGQMVLERIRKAFRRLNPRSPVVLSCKLRPLRPAELMETAE